jgi:hypothetical protein
MAGKWRPKYKCVCSNCGWKGKRTDFRMSYYCPRCKEWGTVERITEQTPRKEKEEEQSMMNERIERALEAQVSEREQGFTHVVVLVAGERIAIDTRASRDPSRRNNGGDYDFWLRLWPQDGNIFAQERCSCDFWQPEEETGPEVIGNEADWPGLSHEIVTKAQERGLVVRYE